VVFNLEGKKGAVIVVSQCRPQTALYPRPLSGTPILQSLPRGCRGAAGEILVLAQAGHNSLVAAGVGY